MLHSSLVILQKPWSIRLYKLASINRVYTTEHYELKLSVTNIAETILD